IPARFEFRQQVVNQPADLSSEDQVRHEVSAVPLQQPLPYSDNQPMILSSFDSGNEQDIARRKACDCLLTIRESIAETRSHVQGHDARQSPTGLRNKRDECSPCMLCVGEHDVRDRHCTSKLMATLNSVV